METNHAGEIDRQCSGLGVALPAGVSGISGAPVRTNIRQDSDRRAAIDPAVPAILVTIDRPAALDLRAVAVRRLDLANLGVPANTGRSCPR
jgi:hypothetical protein